MQHNGRSPVLWATGALILLMGIGLGVGGVWLAVIINDPLYAVDLALSDIGLVYVFEPLVREYLRVERLIQVLPEASIEEPGLFLYFPRRASLSPKLRAFIDTAKAVLRPDAMGPAA
ncbi:LysR substrate-binding domain-containing protein [Microvirga arabica]|uniref:LysR substrate-binding domain-containing protein n=1 Tax=Microvirga arabica TaxID=1128671 RepID=UPI001939E9F0|nr:hypothetical protein [Microvirga arabica]